MNAATRQHEAQADLEAELDSLRATVARLNDGLFAIHDYVTSPKFNVDTKVETGDIVAMLREVRRASLDEECQPRGLRSAIRNGNWRMVPDYERPVRQYTEEVYVR